MTPDDQIRQMFVEAVQDEEADELLVKIAAEAMLEKLAKKRADGRMGWWTTNASNADLEASLRWHVDKGDMADVLNIAAMIMVRRKLYGSAA